MKLPACPICGATKTPSHPQALPFCSTRCRQVDLGKWLNADYRIPVSDDSADAEEELGEEHEI